MPVDLPDVKRDVTQLDHFARSGHSQSAKACGSRVFLTVKQFAYQLLSHTCRNNSFAINLKPTLSQRIWNAKGSCLKSKHSAWPISFIFSAKIFTDVHYPLLTKLRYRLETYPTEGSGRREAQPQRMRFGSALSYPLGWDTLLGSQDGALVSWTLQPLAPGSSSHQSLRHGCGLNFILPLSHSTGS